MIRKIINLVRVGGSREGRPPTEISNEWTGTGTGAGAGTD